MRQYSYMYNCSSILDWTVQYGPVLDRTIWSGPAFSGTRPDYGPRLLDRTVQSQNSGPDCLQIGPVRSGPSPLVRSGQSNCKINLPAPKAYNGTCTPTCDPNLQPGIEPDGIEEDDRIANLKAPSMSRTPPVVQVLKVVTMAASIQELLGDVRVPILRSVIVAMIATKIPQLLRNSRVSNLKAATIAAGIWGLFRDVAVPILTS